jgi:VIT1/CCC1 family predicted Fe2+/Mn2+ transporter
MMSDDVEYQLDAPGADPKPPIQVEHEDSTSLSTQNTRERHLRVPLASSQHLGSHRQYWRDIILGVNDGLVSTFLLVAGVAGGGLSSTDILLTAIAGALAGAVSMCAGEYVATKSQNEVLDGEINLESEHIEKYLGDEVQELTDLLPLIGIPDKETHLQQTLIEYYRNNPDALLQIMIALEFGVIDEERRRPVCAGLMSCTLFILGALPSVIPFIFSGDRPMKGLIAAAVITVVCLLTVGAIKTWATRGNCFRASIENLVIAGFGGAFAYGVGVFFDSVLHP